MRKMKLNALFVSRYLGRAFMHRSGDICIQDIGHYCNTGIDYLPITVAPLKFRNG